MGQLVRCVTIFSGRVQGVGFRYTCVALARHYPGVTGYAQNLRDGTVKLVAEGPEADVSEFIEDVGTRMAAYITRTDTTRYEHVGEYDRFDIRF